MALCSLALACGDAEPPGSSEPRPSVLLITVDTLRADRCSLHGYSRATTPFLEELAETATVFDRAYATSSWTAPSIASLFTGLPPRAHGVVKGFVWEGKVIGQDYLDDQFATLAERLAANGYTTFGVSSNAHLTKRTGFGQGFDHFAETWWEDAPTTNRLALAFRNTIEAAGPWFLWVHYFDPHFPYEPRDPWFGEYERAGWPWSERYATVPNDVRTLAEDMINKYDSEINLVDASIRDLFEALPLDDALVIVTADHGEAFLDHGAFGHGTSLFEEEIRIPMLVRFPEQRTGRRSDAPVGLLDLYPTILDVAGIATPSPLPGRSLRTIGDGDHATSPIVVTELERGPKVETTVLAGTWKLYRREVPTPSVELYDLAADPQERVDRAADRPDLTRSLKEDWDTWARAWPRTAARRLVAPYGDDEGAHERLRALGYLE